MTKISIPRGTQKLTRLPAVDIPQLTWMSSNLSESSLRHELCPIKSNLHRWKPQFLTIAVTFFVGENTHVRRFFSRTFRLMEIADLSLSIRHYCWWLKSCTSWYGKYPIIYKVLAPSQVVSRISEPSAARLLSFIHQTQLELHDSGYAVRPLTFCTSSMVVRSCILGATWDDMGNSCDLKWRIWG